MKEQSFNDNVNSLTGMSSSNSGFPTAIDEQAPTDAFERSWNWDFEVREPGPDEMAECKVTMGADDLAKLTVDGEERLDIGPRGEYGGGSYEPQTTSFSIEPGMHHEHVDYSNISIPNPNNNIARFTFDLKVEITNHQTGSSSSYVPLETETDPVDNDDEGEEDPCGGTSSGSSSSPNSSSSNPCPNDDNGGNEEEPDPDSPLSPDDCADNRGGFSSASVTRRRASSASVDGKFSSAGRRVTAQARKTSMVWRASFGSFRGMEGVPYGMLEIVAYNFSSRLWTPAALQYLHLISVSLNDGADPFVYGYHAGNGLLETLDYPNTLRRWYTREEKRDLLTGIDYLRPGSANYPAKTDYAYDALGRPTEKKDYFNTPAPDLTHSYSYNSRGELVADAMSRGGTYAYAYDNISNRVTSREGSGAPAAAYTANNLNQYTAITREEEAPFAPAYDANGNQTKIQTSTGEWEVSYNVLNQAVSFIQGNRRVECLYDYLSRRIEKAVYEGEILMSKKRFINHGYLQIAELDAASATETEAPVLRRTYLWDPLEPVATRVLAMSLFDETGTCAEDLYYTHDLLKNTTALFGIRAGRRALYEYGAYGNVIKMEGNAAEENPFRFSSEYADDELGLVYYNYRYYNPVDGRWFNRDFIEERDGWNLYSFVKNHPSIACDRWGKTGIWFGDTISLAQGTEASIKAIQKLLEGYEALRKANIIGADKWFHCLYMCRAARESKSPEIVLSSGALRELVDLLKGRFKKAVDSKTKKKLEEVEQALDSLEDMKANKKGINCPSDKTCECCCEEYKVNGIK